MALLLDEDFAGALGVTLHDNASLVAGRDGNGAGLGFAASPFGGRVQKTFESATLTAGFYVRADRIDQAWSFPINLARVTADDGDAGINVFYSAPGIDLGFTGTSEVDSDPDVDLGDRFHFVEIQAQLAEEGYVSVRVDKVEKLRFDGDTAGGTGTTYESIRLEGNIRIRSTVDDLYLTDDLTFRGAPLWSLPGSYDTCGDLIGSLDGCRLHLNAGEIYCNRCNAAWLATRGKLIDSSRKIATASRSVHDDVGVLPPIPLRKGA